MIQLISQLFNKWAYLKSQILYSMHLRQILMAIKKEKYSRMEDNEINIEEAGWSTN